MATRFGQHFKSRSLAIEKASPLSPSITLLTNGPRSMSVFCLPDFEDFRLAPDFGVETADVGWAAWVAPDKSGKVTYSSASSAAGSVAVVQRDPQAYLSPPPIVAHKDESEGESWTANHESSPHHLHRCMIHSSSQVVPTNGVLIETKAIDRHDARSVRSRTRKNVNKCLPGQGQTDSRTTTHSKFSWFPRSYQTQIHKGVPWVTDVPPDAGRHLLRYQYELETGSSNAQLLPRQRGMTQGP